MRSPAPVTIITIELPADQSSRSTISWTISAMLGVQIRFVCLIAWIGWHSILLGREWVHDASFESRTRKRSFGSEVIVSGSLDNNDGVLNVVLLLSHANALDGCPEVTRLMLERLWLNEQLAKVIRHHPFGPMLCGINTDDSKPRPTDLLHTRPDDAVRFLKIR